MGRWFEAYVKRRSRNASASFQELEEEEVSSEESEDEEFQLEEYPMLRTLDPKDWKVLVQIRGLRHRNKSHQTPSGLIDWGNISVVVLYSCGNMN